jgi:hypothetical protein
MKRDEVKRLLVISSVCALRIFAISCHICEIGLAADHKDCHKQTG